MNTVEKEKLINRICSGCIQLGDYIYEHPSPKRKLKADLVYQTALTDGFSHENAIELLISQGKWDKKYDKEISIDIPKVIEDLKVQIYQLYGYDKAAIPKIKEKLGLVKQRLLDLITLKRTYDEFTVEAVAERERTLYLIRKCAKCDFPDKLISLFYDSQLTDSQIRELARSVEWSTKWTAIKRGLKVFSENLTQEQEFLVKWSSLYENILEQQDCPDDDVIDDDDALDGWLIWKRRDSERNRNADSIESRIKDKNAQEVYLPMNKKGNPVFVPTEEDLENARKIESANSPEAMRRKQEKAKAIQKMGEVAEFEVKDGRLMSRFVENQVQIGLARNNAERGS